MTRFWTRSDTFYFLFYMNRIFGQNNKFTFERPFTLFVCVFKLSSKVSQPDDMVYFIMIMLMISYYLGILFHNWRELNPLSSWLFRNIRVFTFFLKKMYGNYVIYSCLGCKLTCYPLYVFQSRNELHFISGLKNSLCSPSSSKWVPDSNELGMVRLREERRWAPPLICRAQDTMNL